jgi:hypothetical protein
MQNEQLLDRVQGLLLGMEERVVAQINNVEGRLGNVEGRLGNVDTGLAILGTRVSAVETQLQSMSRELALNNELLGPFIRWSHRVEDEVIRLSAQLQDVQSRLAKLEKVPRQ